MPIPDDPFADDLSEDDAREIERRMNIHRLKNEANELAGGKMFSSESSDAPSEILEGFWKHVVQYERAPLVAPLDQLAADGVAVPPAEELSDDELHARLWQIIERLATRRTFLYWTNHLSDRELYEWLREEGLTEEMPDVRGMNCHTSPIGSGNEEDTWLFYRFYGDERDRELWMQQFPDYEMPDRIEPPFERDHLLPQADGSVGDDEDWNDDLR